MLQVRYFQKHRGHMNVAVFMSGEAKLRKETSEADAENLGKAAQLVWVTCFGPARAINRRRRWKCGYAKRHAAVGSEPHFINKRRKKVGKHLSDSRSSSSPSANPQTLRDRLSQEALDGAKGIWATEHKEALIYSFFFSKCSFFG